MKPIKTIFLILILTHLSCSKGPNNPGDEFICDIENPVPKGNRTIGIDLLDLTETNKFDQNIALATELGIESIELQLSWSSIETSANNYEDLFNALELLGLYAQNNSLKFSLTISPIDIPG